jgi:hypothetical protein
MAEAGDREEYVYMAKLVRILKDFVQIAPSQIYGSSLNFRVSGHRSLSG